MKLNLKKKKQGFKNVHSFVVLKDAAEKEREQNREEFNKMLGHIVQYGTTIQVIKFSIFKFSAFIWRSG